MPCKKLDELHELIDRTRLEKLLSGVRANRKGEKAWPPLMMFKALFLQRMSRLQIFRFLRIPASLPYTFAAAKTSSTIAVVGTIVAELSGSDKGIGHILQISVCRLETTIMFSAILFIAAFGILFYLISRRSSPWLRLAL